MRLEDLFDDWRALDNCQRLFLLAKIVHTITLLGRSTYEVEGDSVERPATLRRLVELCDRISADVARELAQHVHVTDSMLEKVLGIEMAELGMRDSDADTLKTLLSSGGVLGLGSM